MRVVARANAAWSPTVAASASSASPARSSIQSCTSAMPGATDAGGSLPVSRSRTIRPTAVDSGTSARVRARASGSDRSRIASA